MKKILKALAMVLAAVMALALFTACETSDGKKEDYKDVPYPVATIIVKDYGTITAELYPDIAPETVKNFISLANSGYYDGIIFHRVIKNFMIQGGDPKGNGTGGPGYCIKGEYTANGFTNNLKHTRGVLSMARKSNPYVSPDPYMDSAGSQFFIMHVDYPSLDGMYASFGKVTEGLDVVDMIAGVAVNSSNNKPLTDVVIESIRVDTKGVTYPEPEKLPEI